MASLSSGLIVMATVLVSGSCRYGASPSVRVDGDLTKYVPQGTTMLAGVDVEGLRKTPLYRRHANDLQTALKALQAQGGIDASRDLTSAMVPFLKGQPLILLHGRFQTAEPAARLEAAGAKRSDTRGGQLFLNGPDAFYFPNDGIAIAGPERLVRQVAGTRSNGMPAGLLESMRPLQATDQIWIASDKGIPIEAAPLRPDLKSAASSLAAYVSKFDAGISVDAGAQVHIDLYCDSAENAAQVNAVLRAGLGLARFSTKDNDLGLHKIYDAVRISYDHETVRVRADLTSDLADELVDALSKTH